MVKRPTERGAPLHFAGRELELALFQNFLESADPRAGILLVTGMPGVGKSQLLHRFEANSRAAGLAVLSLNTADLAIGDSQLFMQIAHAMGMDDAGARIADKAPKQSGRRWSLKALVGTSYGETTEHVREERTLNAMMTMLSREGPPRLLVAIDELQNIDEDGATRLRVLHEGEHGCPVQVIGAGLQHTLDVLRQHGISRTAAPIELGPLARPETYEAFVEGYSAGTGAKLADKVAERMAERSQDFPQHITGYLQGAVAAFEKHGDVVGDAIEEAVAHGDKIRRQYYDHRLDAVGGIPQALPLIELFEYRAEMSRTGIEAALNDKGIDGAEMVSAAIRHGLLTQRRGILSIGIPSFRSYLQDESKTYRKVLQREGHQ